eukprot:TRINITY_DN13440_c0_g1_i1.p1 TRINITY_DN13440_c0_g1~~TRINITY_DN13440_c0_g1_i1.p1  ORF type:complete len:693 (+),score=132.23 TRINITY_DN13440_c0_g1_i1:22-2079(+)
MAMTTSVDDKYSDLRRLCVELENYQIDLPKERELAHIFQQVKKTEIQTIVQEEISALDNFLTRLRVRQDKETKQTATIGQQITATQPPSIVVVDQAPPLLQQRRRPTTAGDLTEYQAEQARLVIARLRARLVIGRWRAMVTRNTAARNVGTHWKRVVDYRQMARATAAKARERQQTRQLHAASALVQVKQFTAPPALRRALDKASASPWMQRSADLAEMRGRGARERRMNKQDADDDMSNDMMFREPGSAFPPRRKSGFARQRRSFAAMGDERMQTWLGGSTGGRGEDWSSLSSTVQTPQSPSLNIDEPAGPLSRSEFNALVWRNTGIDNVRQIMNDFEAQRRVAGQRVERSALKDVLDKTHLALHPGKEVGSVRQLFREAKVARKKLDAAQMQSPGVKVRLGGEEAQAPQEPIFATLYPDNPLESRRTSVVLMESRRNSLVFDRRRSSVTGHELSRRQSLGLLSPQSILPSPFMESRRSSLASSRRSSEDSSLPPGLPMFERRESDDSQVSAGPGFPVEYGSGSGSGSGGTGTDFASAQITPPKSHPSTPPMSAQSPPLEPTSLPRMPTQMSLGMRRHRSSIFALAQQIASESDNSSGSSAPSSPSPPTTPTVPKMVRINSRQGILPGQRKDTLPRLPRQSSLSSEDGDLPIRRGSIVGRHILPRSSVVSLGGYVPPVASAADD